MRRIAVFTVAATLGATAPALAQQQPKPANKPVKTFASAFVVGTTDAGSFHVASARWNLGSGIGGGVALQRLVGQGLLLGAEATYLPSVGTELQRTDTSGVTDTDNASVLTAMATGRIATGGGGGLALFLAGGVGMVGYSLPSGPALDSKFDTDFAVRTSAGLEYQASRRSHVFLEWGHFWAFHPSSGVDTETNKFSQFRGGVRFGW